MKGLAGYLTLAVVMTVPACGQGGIAGLGKDLGEKKVVDGWIYEDVKSGYALAKKANKPLLVAFR